MKKVVLNIATSLDGFIAGPNGEIDWLFTDGDYGLSDFFKTIDSTLIGNKTYQLMLKMGENGYSGMTNYVFTRKPTESKSDNVIFVSDNIVEFVRQLKDKDGKNIWLVGGGEIANVFFAASLVDEMILSVHPIILGDGIPLFKRSKRIDYKLTDCIKYPSGLVQLLYRLS